MCLRGFEPVLCNARQHHTIRMGSNPTSVKIFRLKIVIFYFAKNIGCYVGMAWDLNEYQNFMF